MHPEKFAPRQLLLRVSGDELPVADQAMITFGKMLVKKAECTSAHLRSLVAGMGVTAANVPGCERTGVQRDLEALAKLIDCAAHPEEVDSQLAQALRLIEIHNRATEGTAVAQQKELRAMIAATTDTVAAISSSSKDGIDHLRKLEASLEQAADVEDLRLLRNRLFACLTLVRNETLRMQLESQKLTRALKSVALKASSQLLPGTDGITGLPGPDALQKSVHDLLQQGAPFSAAIFVVNDLQSLNSRFGRQTGDEILQHTSEYLQSQVTAGESTYRWNGPAFLMTCTGDEATLTAFESRAKAIARQGMVWNQVDEGKTKSLAITFSWVVQRFDATSDPERVMRAVEECTHNLQAR